MNDVDKWAAAGSATLQQDTAQQIRNNLTAVSGKSADQAAQYQHLANFVQAPVEAVYDDPDGVKAQASARQVDADAIAVAAPATARYLADPNGAAKSHDDVHTLAGVEAAAKALPAPGKPNPSFLAGLADSVGENLKSLVSAPGSVSAPAELAKGLGGYINKAAGAVNLVLGAVPTAYDKAASVLTGRQSSSASDYWFQHMVEPRMESQAGLEVPKDAPFVAKGMNMAGGLLGMMGAVAATGGGGAVAEASSTIGAVGQAVVHGVKSMAFPAIIDSISTANNVYQQTGDLGAAMRAAQMQYLTTSAAGVVPLSMPGALPTRLGAGFASGAVLGEAGRSAMNMVLPASMAQPFDLEGTILSGLAGSILGGAMGPRSQPVYHEAMRQTYADSVRADRAAQGAQAIQALGEMASSSKTRERDPTAFRQLVADMTENGQLQDVYISAEQLGEVLNQSGVTQDQLAKQLPEVAAQMHEAGVTNGDVRIPVADYATHIAGGPLDAALLPHLKTDAEGMTFQEAQDHYAGQQDSMKETAGKMGAEQAKQDAKAQDGQAVHDAVLAQLDALKRFNPETNKSYAALMRAFFETQGERHGMTALEAYESSGLNIKGQALDDVLNQGGAGERELIVQHNLTEGNLLHAHKLGGMAVPSLAITRASAPLHGFGEISLLGSKDMVDPKKAGNKVFGSDIYSPRYPSIGHKVDKAVLKSINSAIKPFSEFGGADIYASEIGNDAVSGLLERNAVKAAALAKMGVEVKPVLVDGKLDEWKTTMALRNAIHDHDAYGQVEAFARDLLQEAGAAERIFTGYSRSGNQTFVPHTLENVIKILQKELRGGESFNYGVGSVRSKFTPQFKSIEQIIKNKDKLVDGKTFEKIKEEIGKEFDGQVDALKPFHDKSGTFGFGDTVAMMMGDSAKSGVPRALEMNGFKDVPAAEQKAIAEFLNKLRTLPTEYFEAKALRAVPLSEFKTAVVPEGTSQAVLDALAKEGVTDIHTYKKGDEADRAAKIQSADHLLFQANRGAYDPKTATLALFKAADLSTFLHESGHFFLEAMTSMAARPKTTDSMRTDAQALLTHLGVEGTPEMGQLDRWAMMSVDEKRAAHEQFAVGFEKYLMEGKAPTIELQGLFSRFRSWLLNVYKSLAGLDVKLSPEVRGIMDRMLASDEAIREAEQTRKYKTLFDNADDSVAGRELFAKYEGLGQRATDEAIADMTGRSMRDMKWASNAKAKALRELQKDAAEKRAILRQQVSKEVMAEPVYQAWQFLTLRGHDDTRANRDPEFKLDPKHVDTRVDNLYVAIAKMGGLNRDEVKTKWGVDHKDMPDSGVFGKPILRKSGGLSIERMAEKLVEDHYLDAHDLAEFEDKFDRQRGGQDQFSWEHQYSNGERTPAEPVGESNFHGKLDTRELRHMYGEGDETVRRLAEQRMTSEKSGLDPDIVAEMVGGFADGREMIEHLLAAHKPSDLINQLTDQRMLEQHGELTDAAHIEQAANEAVHNETRARFMATGLKILSKSPLPARQLVKAAREAAEASIAAKRVRDLRPVQYLAAEARSNAQALKLAPKDPAGAVQAQRAALLNNQLFRAADSAVRNVQKSLKYLARFDKDTVRAKIDLEYRDQIDALLDRYDLRKSVSGAALDKREALTSFVERMAAAGFEPNIPERLLNEAQRTHYKEMTVEEFGGLVDAVKSIDHLGRLKSELLDGREKRSIDALAKEAADTMAELKQRTPESNRGLTRIGEKWLGVKSAGRSLQASLLKMEQMLDWLDNRNPNGVLNRVVFRRIADAGVKEYDLQKQVKAGIDGLLHSHLADVTKEGNKIYVAERLIDRQTGRAQRFTKKELLSLAGNVGNDSNLSKLANGEKWQESDVWGFLHDNMTKADWDFVAGLGRTLETLWPEKLAMSRRLGNSNPDKIEPRPFDTPHGRYDGWYWPMVYDPARSQDVAERGARAGDSMFENIYSRANTDTGRMNTRKESYARPILLSLDVIPRVIKDEIHDIAYREAIMDADRFLHNGKVREAIVSALSQEHYDQLRPWLQSIANDRKVDMQALKWFDALAHGARTRATIVGLGYRISTMLVHGSSAALESIAEVGPLWMAKGIADFGNPLQWAANKDFIFERSGEMRNRMNEVDRDVREHLREIDLRLMDTTTGLAARGADILKAHAYQGIAMLDMMSAMPTWMAAYHKGMAPEAEGGRNLSEQDAIYFADKTVRNAHGGTGVKDQAAIQRGPEFLKLFTMFYTFWNHNVNRLMDTARLAGELPETYRSGAPGEFKGDLGTVIMRTLIYTLGIQALHGMLHPKKDGEGDDGWVAWAAKEFAASAFAGIPVLRDLSAHYLTGKDYSVTPAASMVDAMGKSGQDAANVMAGRDSNPKWVKHTVTTAGYVFGLPLGQPASAVQFLWDVGQGQAHPENVSDWWRGIVHGDMKKH